MNRLSVTLFFFLLSAGLQADEPLRYVAPGAKVFFGVEVGKVLSSPFGKLLLSAFS